MKFINKAGIYLIKFLLVLSVSVLIHLCLISGEEVSNKALALLLGIISFLGFLLVDEKLEKIDKK
jgi:hypothetical protein